MAAFPYPVPLYPVAIVMASFPCPVLLSLVAVVMASFPCPVPLSPVAVVMAGSMYGAMVWVLLSLSWLDTVVVVEALVIV